MSGGRPTDLVRSGSVTSSGSAARGVIHHEVPFSFTATQVTQSFLGRRVDVHLQSRQPTLAGSLQHHAADREDWPPLPSGLQGASEASLPSSQTAAASLGPGRTPARGPTAPRARVVRIERSRGGRPRQSVLGCVDGEPSTLDLAIVKQLDRRGRLGLRGELDEREPPGPPGLAIRGQVDFDDVASLGQERGQSIRGRAEGEIPDEDAGCDGGSLPLQCGRVDSRG
jgi:hypothetical protein